METYSQKKHVLRSALRSSFAKLLASKATFDHEETQHLLRGFLSLRLNELGLLCRADSRGEPVIQLAPPLIASTDEFEIMNGVLRTALTEAMAEMDAFR